MREIKFRAWVDGKCMCPVAIRGDGKYYHMTSTGFAAQYDPQYEALTVEQFTGIHDKNGREIYEGDVIQPRINIRPIIVKWDDYKSGYSGHGESWEERYHGYHVDAYGLDFSDCEIIGNIHENPELVND